MCCACIVFSEVVMTPSKKGRVTHIKIERRKKHAVNPDDVHVAGGEHQGLVVAKPDAVDERPVFPGGYENR